MDQGQPTGFALDAFVVNRVHVEPSALRLSSVQGQSVLEPKVMALLVVLARKPGELWSRKDLIDEIWPNGFGGDESLSRLVSLLRKAFSGDHGLDDIVKTVPKLGYRLDATVDFSVEKTAIPKLPDESPETSSAISARPGWFYAIGALMLLIGVVGLGYFFTTTTGRESQSAADNSHLSLAVLPIESLGPLKDSAFLADGMTRDLTAMLSRVPNARVAPYSSTRVMVGESTDGKTAAEQLGVRYVISGSLTEQGGQLVLRMNLEDTKAGEQIWSKRFVQPLANFFDLQEQVIQEIATSIFSEIQASEMAELRNEDEFNLSVYELIQKAKSERYVYGRGAAMRVISDAERALAFDPDNYSARAILATQLAQNVISGYSDDPAHDIPLALKSLDQMRAIAPRDPEVLTATALVRLYIKGERQQAIRLLEESLLIDPNELHAAVVLGSQKCYSGNSEEGLPLILNAEARAPRDPRYSIWPWFRSGCLAVKGDIALARDASQDAIDRNPNYPGPYFALAQYECLLGNKDAAGNAIQRSRQIDPDYTQNTFEQIMTKVGYPGSPGQSRDEQFRIMRACVADKGGSP